MMFRFKIFEIFKIVKMRSMFRLYNLTLVLSLLVSFQLMAQNEDMSFPVRTQYYNPPIHIRKLPSTLSETSGLIYYNGLFWTHNDSGGEPEIYGIDTLKGKLVQTIHLNATNKDWEDIAQDDDYIFIGDFGNNIGTRNDLCIYRIEKKQILLQGDISLTPEVIRFKWDKSAEMSFPNRKTNFDCEAMFSLHDRLILLTKNWGNQRTSIYSLPKVPGDHSPIFLLDFNADGLITGADFLEIDETLALSGYKNYVPFVWLIKNFQTIDTKGWTALRLELDDRAASQAEGICFGPAKFLYLSSEATAFYPALIFKLDYPSLSSHLPLRGEDVFSYQYAFDNDQLRIMTSCKKIKNYKVQILDNKGKLLKEWKMKCTGNADINVWSIHESSKKLILRIKGDRYEVTSVLDADFLR